MVARRSPLFINATAMCIAIVVFPEPPFSLPTTMTWGKPRDLTAAFSIAEPRNNQFQERQLPMPSLARTTSLGEVTRSVADSEEHAGRVFVPAAAKVGPDPSARLNVSKLIL